MSRKIKFRAWKKSSIDYDGRELGNRWEDSVYIRTDGGVDYYDGYELCGYEEDYIIQQWTGLVDRNGKEIYEGDIVKVSITAQFQNAGTYISEVVFEQGRFFGKNSSDFGMRCFGDKISYYPGLGEGFEEVIGNIFENPELLNASIQQ